MPDSARNQLESFRSFCNRAEFRLEPFQRRIARAFFKDDREFLVLLPRGNGKSRLIAAFAVHHLLSEPQARVYVAASSREQAGVVHEYAKDFARAVAPELVVNQREIRTESGYLRVVASDAGKLQGLSPTLAIVDELHVHRDAEVYLAMRTAMQKRPGARLVVISTAGTGPETPLGRLRARAAMGTAATRGCFTEALGEHIRMLEWAVPEVRDPSDLRAAKMANPASWITRAGLREQREALPESAWRRYHLNQWIGRVEAWLPPGAWAALKGEVQFDSGEPIWIGIDVGAARSASAVVWVNKALSVGSWIGQGEDSVFEAAHRVMQLADSYEIREVVFDPWRAAVIVKQFEMRGIKCTSWPWTDSRVVPAAAELYSAISGGELTHDGDEELARHMAAVVGKPTRRGVRIDKASEGDQIDGASALLMAFESATSPAPAKTEILGWL